MSDREFQDAAIATRQSQRHSDIIQEKEIKTHTP